jgi:hypothetical protein
VFYERNDAPRCQRSHPLAQRFHLCRLHAYALRGLALEERTGRKRYPMTMANVREHAIRLSESSSSKARPPRVLEEAPRALQTRSWVCAINPAFSLGEIRHPERLGVLAQIARRRSRWCGCGSVVAGQGAGEMFSLLPVKRARRRRRRVA